MLRIFLVLLTISCITNKVYATNSELQPILRIETGRHTTSILAISSDSSGKVLATGSADKTLRIWDATTGKLTKTLRPYIARNPEEGVVVSVAVSPDASHIACTYVSEPEKRPIDYEKPNGPVKQVPVFSTVVYNTTTWVQFPIANQDLEYGEPVLKFTRDGKYLVLANMIAMDVYKTSDWKQHGLGMFDYKIVDMDTIGNNKFAVLDAAGHVNIMEIRDNKPTKKTYEDTTGIFGLWASNIRKLATYQLPNPENQPHDLATSPDGHRFAVGYQKGSKIVVGSVFKNKSFFELDARNTRDIELGVKDKVVYVTWSQDGKSIDAGIVSNTQQYRATPPFVRRWNLSQKKAPHIDIPMELTKDSSLDALASSSNNGVAFASGSLLGITHEQSTRLLPPFIASKKQPSPAASESGTMLSLYFQTKQNEMYGDPFVFDVRSRLLLPRSKSIALIDAKQDNPPGMDLKPYFGINTLNGIKLELLGDIESWAFSADGSSCLVATSGWQLIRFDKGANTKWSTRTPATATGLTVTNDGRFVVASLSDGSFYWYSHETGEELLAFFPSNDRRSWALWTPSGYYDASPKGDELIGWYFKESKEKSGEFYSASRFKSLYYRPDIINKVLETLSESKAIEAANEEAGRKLDSAPAVATIVPPTVTILSPVSGNDFSERKLTLRYRVESTSDEPVTSVKILVDGRPVATNRGLKAVQKNGTEQAITINLPGRDCEIGVIAENRYSSSEPATVRLKWIGKRAEEFVIKPKMYLLSIGVSEYKQGDLKLKYAAKDAQDFVRAMENQKGGLYRDVISRVLVNASATKDGILDSLEWIQKEATNNDVAVIFLAGHGVNDSNGTYYFLPENVEVDRLKRTGVSIADIKQTVSTLAGKVLLFVDTCHSGNIFGGRRALADINAIVNDLSSAENGAVVFASSTGRQYSLEKDEWKNGAFTKALVEGISGKADYTKKGSITVNMLDLYLSERVKELTEGKQTPATAKPASVPDFPLAVRQ